MANHCIPDGFRNNQPKSRPSGGDIGCLVRTCVVARMHDDRTSARPATTLHRAPKLRRRRELVLGWKHNLCSQLCAALLATSCNNGATCTGAHAGAEAVLASTTTVVRLERPLALGHGDTPCSVDGARASSRWMETSRRHVKLDLRSNSPDGSACAQTGQDYLSPLTRSNRRPRGHVTSVTITHRRHAERPRHPTASCGNVRCVEDRAPLC